MIRERRRDDVKGNGHTVLTLRATRTCTDIGGRVELIVNGPNLPSQLQGEPIFFEVSGSDVAEFDVLDGVVSGLVHFLMETRQSLHVEGRLSKTYLRSIAEYQRFWSLVRPERCSIVKITADEIVADQGDQRDLPAVASYSGGLDSAFSIVRHKLNLVGMDTIPLEAVLIVHGFDVSSADESGFARLLDRLQPLIEDLGLRRYVVRTNLKEYALQNWVESYTAQLVSCLHMVGHRHSSAIVASDGYGQTPVFEFGGNPISVPLLTSSRLKIFYDGPSYTRSEKAALLAKYPRFLRSLKFCFEGPDPAKNCGHCMKCFLTYMNFRAVGVENPECFDARVNEELVGNYTIKHDAALALRYPLLEELRKNPELAELTARFEKPVLWYERQAALKDAKSSAASKVATPGTDGAAEDADIVCGANVAEIGGVQPITAESNRSIFIEAGLQFLHYMKAFFRS